MFFCYFCFTFGFSLLFDCMQTFFDLQLFQANLKSSQIMKARLSGLNCLFHHIISILLLTHIFNLRQENLVHSGVGICICKLKKIITVEVWHFFPQPFILYPIEIAIQNEVFSQLYSNYLLSQACIFYEKQFSCPGISYNFKSEILLSSFYSEVLDYKADTFENFHLLETDRRVIFYGCKQLLKDHCLLSEQTHHSLYVLSPERNLQVIISCCCCNYYCN